MREGSRSVLREPLAVAAVVLCLAEVAWNLINFDGPVGPAWVGSVPMIAVCLLTSVATGKAWRTPGTTPIARRFWRLLTISFVITAVFTLADLRQYRDGPVIEPGPIALAGFIVSTVLTLVALYRYPLGIRSRGERLRLLLDSATVTLAAVLFAWYVQFGHGAPALSASMVAASIVFSATHALTVFALVRVLMSESRDVPKVAVRAFTAGIAASTVGILAIPMLADREPAGAEPLGRTLAYTMFILAAVLHHRQVNRAAEAWRQRRRPFSVAPYIAVASVDALLLATVAGNGVDVVVAAVVVTLTGLVIVRQLAAFRDNARLLDELARQERRFRSLVQNAADAIVILDESGRATYASPGIEALSGFPATYWLGRQAFNVHPDDQQLVRDTFLEARAAPGNTVEYDGRIGNAGHGWQWVRVVLTNRLDDPAVGGIVANVSDINDAREFQDQLSHQASHDPLTDLANRSLLVDQLSEAVANGNVSLALIDLDDFKSVNDTMGHPAGDTLLITVAERLRQSVRSTDLVARLGGDEFAIILHGDGVVPVSERMLATLAQPLRIDGHELFVRASIGVAAAGPGDDVDQLMRYADVALYQAKAAGKGCVVHYHPDMVPEANAREVAAGRLYRALIQGEFVLRYQPIVAVDGGAVVGVEALLRWEHPDDGLLAPDAFMPLAEQTGLIVPIGRWMLLEACRAAAVSGGSKINVRVSPRQLREAGIVADVRDALVATGLPPHRLTIEITEVADQARAAVRELHTLGVQLALDAAGTRHSTLALLTDLPIDQLKVDGAPGEPRHRSLALAVVGVARALGITAVESAPSGSASVEPVAVVAKPSADAREHGAVPVS